MDTLGHSASFSLSSSTCLCLLCSLLTDLLLSKTWIIPDLAAFEASGLLSLWFKHDKLS
jgi:hypothetical protein